MIAAMITSNTENHFTILWNALPCLYDEQSHSNNVIYHRKLHFTAETGQSLCMGCGYVAQYIAKCIALCDLIPFYDTQQLVWYSSSFVRLDQIGCFLLCTGISESWAPMTLSPVNFFGSLLLQTNHWILSFWSYSDPACPFTRYIK